MTFSIKTFSIMTFSITTFSISTLSTTINKMRPSGACALVLSVIMMNVGKPKVVAPFLLPLSLPEPGAAAGFEPWTLGWSGVCSTTVFLLLPLLLSGPGANVIKLFTAVSYQFSYKLEYLALSVTSTLVTCRQGWSLPEWSPLKDFAVMVDS